MLLRIDFNVVCVAFDIDHQMVDMRCVGLDFVDGQDIDNPVIVGMDFRHDCLNFETHFNGPFLPNLFDIRLCFNSEMR